MRWNWQQKDWPNFKYDTKALAEYEAQFMYKAGMLVGVYAHIDNEDKNNLTIDLMSDEALKTSAIEGEYLNRDSVQSSIRRQFGLTTDNRKVAPAEHGIAEMMTDLYLNFATPLSNKIMFDWHNMITNGRRDLSIIGAYRSHEEPMQVISGPIHNPKIHFEAPPSKDIPREMKRFIKWFNATAPKGKNELPTLTRAGIAHLYFVSIHPFEDGNGRISRALSEKALSQGISHPTLVSLSHTIERNKKLYYDMLEESNKGLEITKWLIYFAKTILEAQEYTKKKVDFLVEKAKLYDKISGQLNIRQEKAIARIFKEGIDGFKGGLSADNYINITKTSRATATRDLNDLVEKAILIRTGERKHTRYHLNIKF